MNKIGIMGGRGIYTVPPPNTPPEVLERAGLARGGVMNAPWINHDYMDARRPLVPTDSGMIRDVPMNVFGSRMNFAQPDVARVITGPLSGYAEGRPVAQPADLRPLPIVNPNRPIPPRYDVDRGGIFDAQGVPQGFYDRNYPKVPAVRTTETVLAGFGASPDGIGGCGPCGSW